MLVGCGLFLQCQAANTHRVICLPIEGANASRLAERGQFNKSSFQKAGALWIQGRIMRQKKRGQTHTLLCDQHQGTLLCAN